VSEGKGQSENNKLSAQQIWAIFQKMLVWPSGDECGLQSPR